VQEIELGLIVASVIAIVVSVVVRFRYELVRRPVLIGALIGIVPGVLGAVVVLVPRTDLVPDTAEPWIWLGIAVIASVVAMFAIWRGVVER
jgi:hypothetical protein